jgi:hypothetical protein
LRQELLDNVCRRLLHFRTPNYFGFAPEKGLARNCGQGIGITKLNQARREGVVDRIFAHNFRIFVVHCETREILIHHLANVAGDYGEGFPKIHVGN